MSVVFKYPLTVTDRQSVEMPEGAQVLTVQEQHGQPCLWAVVDADAPKVERHFVTRGTGHPFDTLPGSEVGTYELLYLGTYQLAGGAFVGHVFEELAVSEVKA